MKLVIFVAVLVWLLCGVAGDWMIEGNDHHWKMVARGPFTLVDAFNEQPVHVPGTG